jgi:hypothetical protein
MAPEGGVFFDGLRQLFTAGATVTTGGTARGHDALVEQARRRHTRDESIQHIITNLIIDLDGNRAAGRQPASQLRQRGSNGGRSGNAAPTTATTTPSV